MLCLMLENTHTGKQSDALPFGTMAVTPGGSLMSLLLFPLFPNVCESVFLCIGLGVRVCGCVCVCKGCGVGRTCYF